MLERLYIIVASPLPREFGGVSTADDSTIAKMEIGRKIEEAVLKLERQRDKISRVVSRMEQSSEDLLQKFVRAKTQNVGYASSYAHEIVEMRKNVQTLLGAQLAIERVILRLRTVEQLTQMAAAVLPTLDVIHSLRKNLSGFFPEFSRELGKIADEISEVKAQIVIPSNLGVNPSDVAQESRRILSEAEVIAKERVNTRSFDQPSR